jgi:hypothetical protein
MKEIITTNEKCILNHPISTKSLSSSSGEILIMNGGDRLLIAYDLEMFRDSYLVQHNCTHRKWWKEVYVCDVLIRGSNQFQLYETKTLLRRRK